MRHGTSVYQRAYHKRYNPLYGRRILSEQTGFIKEASRALGISGLLGIDPESMLMTNRPIPAKYDANLVIANFLDRYKNIKQNDIQIFSGNGKKYINIGNSPFNVHQCIKSGNHYYIVTGNNYFKESTIPLKIIAKNDDALTSKLAMVFNNPLARAKLELKVQKIPFLHSENLFPGHGRHVLLNDTKIIANSYIQEFESSNMYNAIDETDTALGSVSAAQINYHVFHSDSNHRLSKRNGENFTTIQDDFWIRIGGLSEHLLSSYVTDELMGNIVNMYDSKNQLLPEQRSQTVRKLKEDYIYNRHGKGTENTRKRGESPGAFAYDIKNNSMWKQFEFTANPFRGGRIWRDIPFCLDQTVLALYTPTADGKRLCKYDIDAERFKTEFRKLMITPQDRQYMAAHGRKILGAYVALKLLNDEISLIDLNDTKNKVHNHKKWADLNQLQDELFESTGDMRDFLRYSCNSYGQLKESVKKNIPEFANNKNADAIKKASNNKDDFIKQTKSNFFDTMKDYVYLENFMGWQMREDLGWIICKDIVDKVYDKPISKIRATTASVILMEGMNNLSRELKFIETTGQRDTNAKGVLSHLLDKLRLGDIQGFKEFVEWDKNRLVRGINTESHYANSKLQALQREGIMLERDIYPPMSSAYLGENQGFFTGNTPATRVIYQFSTKMSQNFIDFMHLSALHIKKIQAEMKKKNLTDVYKTESMKHLDDLLHQSAKSMSKDYLNNKHRAFATFKPEDIKKLHFEITKKIHRFLQVSVNVSALLANAPDVVYDVR